MSKELIDALRSVILPNNKGYSVICKVDSVNLTDLTCYCIPINGDADLVNVRLTAANENGFLLIPEVDSIVVVSFLGESSSYISMTSNVSEIRLNGSSNGGIVKASDLVTKLNNLENDINTLKQLFATWIVVPSDGGAALKAITSTWAAQQIIPTQIIDLENTKVKHGS